MKLAHFVITRFCLRGRLLPSSVDGQWFGSVDPLKARTVDLRLKLLETTCLPGLASQTSQEFTWILLVDARLREDFKERLRSLARARDEPREAVFFGARHDLERTVTSHLFMLCPNNSGSTFLQKALATSRRTWNLPYEGQKALGYVGPRFTNDRRMLGGSSPMHATPAPRSSSRSPPAPADRGRPRPALPKRQVPAHGAQPLCGVRGDLPGVA